MTKQLIKEAFYIYRSKIKLYLIPGFIAFAIAALSVLLHNLFRIPSFLTNFFFSLFVEVPCILIYYDKARDSLKKSQYCSLFFSAVLYCIALYIVKHAFSSVLNLTSDIFSTFITVVSYISEIILKFLFSFLYIETVKNSHSVKEAFNCVIKQLSVNKMFAVGLFIKLQLIIAVSVIFVSLIFSIFMAVFLILHIPITTVSMLLAVFLYFNAVFKHPCLQVLRSNSII